MTPRPWPLLRLVALLSWCILSTAGFAAEPAPAARPLPDEAACAAFGQQLAALLDDGKIDDVLKLLDPSAFVARVTPGLGFTEQEAREFQKGALRAMPDTMKRQFAPFDNVHFVRVETAGPERRVLLRLRALNGGTFNYVAFTCESRAPGSMVWVDLFNAMLGDSASQSVHRMALPAIATSKKNLLPGLSPTESTYALHFPAIVRIGELAQAGKNAEAWLICEQLPPVVQNERSVLLLRLQVAQAVDEKKTQGVIDDWEKTFPGDPTLHFLLIDRSRQDKDYAAALRHLEAFSKSLGGDAYLQVTAAYLLSEAGRYDEARQRCRAAQAAEPGLLAALAALLTISLQSQSYTETASLLEEFQTRVPALDLKKFTSTEDYAGFRSSPVYRDWLDRREGRLAPPVHAK